MNFVKECYQFHLITTLVNCVLHLPRSENLYDCIITFCFSKYDLLLLPIDILYRLIVNILDINVRYTETDIVCSFKKYTQ